VPGRGFRRQQGRQPLSRGQSLVEFALLLPILILLTMAALDLGRLYLGYINLQNMARVASNFAANNSTAWLANDPVSQATVTKYRNQVLADAQATNCGLVPATPAPPTFSDADGDGYSTKIGDHATVSFTCAFKLVTPFLSGLLGGTVNVSATSVFPVKSGLSGTGGSGTPSCMLPSPAINATPDTGTVPLTVLFMDASGGGPGTAWAWDFGDGRTSTLRDPGNVVYSTPGTYAVNLTVSNICGTKSTTTPKTITVNTVATPSVCTVPDFSGTPSAGAQGTWIAAHFTSTVKFQQGGLPWTVKSQNIVAGSSAPCGSTITLSKN